MQTLHHGSVTQYRARASLRPSQGPYTRVSWAVPGLPLEATAASVSQNDTAALQYKILTDKEQ